MWHMTQHIRIREFSEKWQCTYIIYTIKIKFNFKTENIGKILVQILKVNKLLVSDSSIGNWINQLQYLQSSMQSSEVTKKY